MIPEASVICNAIKHYGLVMKVKGVEVIDEAIKNLRKINMFYISDTGILAMKEGKCFYSLLIKEEAWEVVKNMTFKGDIIDLQAFGMALYSRFLKTNAIYGKVSITGEDCNFLKTIFDYLRKQGQ